MADRNSLFKKIAPDILEYRGGGGCLSLFGLPFLLAGLFIMQIPLGIIPVQGDSPPWYFIVPFGFVFTAVGAGLVFDRNGLTINLSIRQISQWRGLLIPIKREIKSLDLYNKVRLSKLSGDSDSSDTYPIFLEGSNTGGSLKICASVDFQAAKYSAEELCRFLNFILEDDTSTVKIIRKPGELNESLRQQLRKSGQTSQSLPRKPFEMLCNIQQTAEGYIIEIPWTTVKKAVLANLISNLIVAGFVFYFFLWPMLTLPMPETIRYIFVGFILLFFILGPIISSLLKLRKKKTFRTTVTVTSAFIRIEDTGSRKKSAAEIPAEELEELVLPTERYAAEKPNYSGKKEGISIGETGMPRLANGRQLPKFVHKLMKSVPHPGITLRSRNQLQSFGEGLPLDELVYIHALIRKFIAE